MGSIFRRPGYRFHPTDVELVMYYLRKKVNGKRFPFDVIAEVNVYDFAPWELKEKSCLPSKDLEWYFFCARDKKYASGKRTNRATKYGFWKTTGEDKHISHNFKTVGRRKTLIFYEGRAPGGTRTDWVMHEYRIEDDRLINEGFSKDSFVVCKVFKKSGRGPKNGEQHGATFDEDEWNDDGSEENGDVAPLTKLSSTVLGPERSEDLTLDQLLQQSGAPVVSEAPDSIFGNNNVDFFDVYQLLSEVCGEGGSCNEEKLDAPILQKNGNKDAMCDGYEIYGCDAPIPQENGNKDAMYGCEENGNKDAMYGCDAPIPQENGNKDAIYGCDASIPQENGNKDAMCDDNEIYGGLEDIISKEEFDISGLDDLGHTPDPTEASSTFRDGYFL